MERVGPYRLGQRIGVGGMGEVFLAELEGPEAFAKRVVLKRILPSIAADPASIAMFMSEARISARLAHPNIVQVHDFGEVDGTYYMTMEAVDGVDLRKLARHAKKIDAPLSPELCAFIVAEAALALQYAHDLVDPATGEPMEIVHRDISPHNILVSRFGEVKVGDFGIARARGRDSHTATGAITGKRAYMSPEQCMGAALDRRSDVFSLGVVLHELLTGERLFADPTDLRALQKILHEPVKSPGIDPILDGIVLSALEKQLDRRWQSAALFKRAIDAWLDHLGAHRMKEKLAEWMTRHGSALPHVPFEANAGPPPAHTVPIAVAATRIAPRLPPDASSFVGREDQLTAVAELFAQGARLVTLVGPGGTGKTRLARKHAERVGAAWFADLTAARDLPGVEGAVAATFDAFVGDAGAAGLERVIASRGEMLLVLDNFEQVAAHAPATVGRWIDAAPHAQFLVTSRERLRLPGEIAHEVPPLSLPEAGAPIADAEAVQLFLARASSARPGAAWSKEDLATIGGIVRKLEGIPLALELAAARMSVLGPNQLLARLAEPLDLLSRGYRGASDRQRTLRGAIDWSWNLLDAAEQSALAECAVFRGGFSLESAEEVVGDSVLEVLQSLREKSLVRTYPGPGGEPRFTMYETIREYAEEALERSGRLIATCERHADHFVRLAERWSPLVSSRRANEALDQLALELDNGLIAMERSDWIGCDPLLPERIVLALDPLFEVRGPLPLREQLLQDRLKTIEATAARSPRIAARIAWALARTYEVRGRPADVRETAMMGRVYAERAGDLALLGALEQERGNALRHEGDSEAAYEPLVAALDLLRRGSDRHTEGIAWVRLGMVEADRGHLDAALANFRRGQSIFDQLGDARYSTHAQSGAALLALAGGDLADAEARFAVMLDTARATRDRLSEGAALASMATLRSINGDLAEALPMAARASRLLIDTGEQRLVPWALSITGAILCRLDRVEEAEGAFAQAATFPDPMTQEVVDVLREHLAIARARRLDRSGDAPAAARELARVQAIVTDATADPSRPPSASLRIPLFLLQLELSRG